MGGFKAGDNFSEYWGLSQKLFCPAFSFLTILTISQNVKTDFGFKRPEKDPKMILRRNWEKPFQVDEVLSKNSADALLDEKVSIIASKPKEITNLVLCLLSISTSVSKIIVITSNILKSYCCLFQTPGPMTELNFWAAQCVNLESLYIRCTKGCLSIWKTVILSETSSMLCRCKMDDPINHNKKTASLSGTNGVYFVKLWDCLIWLQHDP